MFGTNSIVGKKFFADSDKLLVTSMFLTLQGEGPYQGQPAVFVRLAKCNLNCSFCDTFFDEGDLFSYQELFTKVINLSDSKYFSTERCGIVVTGGEPSLQLPNLIPFLEVCERAGFAFIQIESNGILSFDEMWTTDTTLVISPKCSEQTGKYLKPHEDSLRRASCLKFVVSSDESSPYHKIPNWALEWRGQTNSPIYVSPMNMYQTEILAAAKARAAERKAHNLEYRSTIDEVVSGWDDKVLDRAANEKNHRYAAQYALDKGLFLTLQMHLYAAVA